MDSIDGLLLKYCPNGVQYKSLGELGFFYGGLSGKSKKDFESGNSRYISYMNIYSNAEVDINAEDYVKISPEERQNKVALGDVFFTGSSEIKEECAISSVLTVEPKEDLYLNSFCFGFRLNDSQLFSPVFLKHLFRSGKIRKALQNTASGVTRYNVSKEKMAKIQIPIPPFNIQTYIANILDNYSRLCDKMISILNQELAQRKIQYSYYREMILSPRKEWKSSTLLNTLVQPITDGPHETPKLVDKGVPFISAEAVQNNAIHFELMRGYITEEYDELCCKKYKPQLGDIYMCKSGSTTGKVAMVETTKRFNIWSPLAAIRVNQKLVLPKYMFYFLQTEFVQKQVKAKASKGSQPNLSMRKLEQFIVYYPDLSSQKNIIEQIEQLNNSVADYCEALEQEIKLRRQQFVYYSDKLLSFAELPK